MNILGIIPARYASTRFPGKPLIDIAGKSMIERVYNRVAEALEYVVVATDDIRIKEAVELFGGKVVMTSEHHQSGTDRCAEAVIAFEKETNISIDVVLNIQGDEPLIDPRQIKQLSDLFIDEQVAIGTLVKKINDADTLFDPNKARVILNKNKEAIYFSRHAIPFIKGVDKKDWLNHHIFYQHIGLYGYSKKVLMQLIDLPQSNLELMESLEQLRWIENGYKIQTATSDITGLSIDTPEDLKLVLEYISNNNLT